MEEHDVEPVALLKDVVWCHRFGGTFSSRGAKKKLPLDDLQTRRVSAANQWDARSWQPVRGQRLVPCLACIFDLESVAACSSYGMMHRRQLMSCVSNNGS